MIGWWRGRMDEWTSKVKGEKVKSCCCFCWCKTYLNKVLHPLNRLPTTWKVPVVTGYSLNFSLFSSSSFCSQLCSSVVMSSHYKFLFFLYVIAECLSFVFARRWCLMMFNAHLLCFLLSERNWRERTTVRKKNYVESTLLGCVYSSLTHSSLVVYNEKLKLFN